MLAAMDMQTALVLEVRDIPQGPVEKLEILYMLEAEEEVESHAAILALEIRKNQGEEPADILDGYTNLTETEKADILAVVMPGKEQPWDRY